MASSASAAGCRFGPFELYFKSLELRRNGRRVRLQEKPLLVLMALAQRPGELVSRADLHERLWSQDTFVAFEDGLNTAVRKLREVLGDDPQSPRYIETERGRGYRLIIAVSTIQPHPGELSAHDISMVPATGETQGSNGMLIVDATDRAQSLSPSQLDSVYGFDGGLNSADGELSRVGEFEASIDEAGIDPAHKLIATATTPRWRWVVYACAAALLACTGVTADWWFSPAPELRAIRVSQLTTNGSIDFLVKPVTDGGRVFYIERAGAHWNLMETSLNGGVPQLVPGVGENTRVMDISPDHTTFLLGRFTFRGSTSSLWLMPVQGGSPVRLGNIESGEAVWMPDGHHILYAKEHELWIVGADDTGARLFAVLPGPPNWLTWSPDGTRLRFSADDKGHNTIWELRSDGSQLHRVLSPEQSPGEEQCCGEWTPDGHFFVFTAITNLRPNLWIFREPGFGLRRTRRNPVQLTDLPTGAWGAHVTPLGKSVLFYAGRNRSQIVRLNLKNNELAPVAGEGFSQPDYSPDGKWVVYVDVNNGTLWKAAADGTTRLPLSLPGYRANFPRWSPDGSQIAVNISEAGNPSNVFLVPASGGAPTLLLSNQRSYDVDWSPDGKSVVVVHDLAGHPEQRALFIVDLATRREKMVADSVGRFFPHWSRDGRYLSAYDDNDPGVFVLDMVTNQWRQIAHGILGFPIWSHDGHALYFQKVLEEDEPVYRYIPQTQATTRVADCRMELEKSAFRCVLLGLTPDDSPLFDVTRGDHDLYGAELTFPK